MIIDPKLIYLGQVFEGIRTLLLCVTMVTIGTIILELLFAFTFETWEKRHTMLLIIATIVTLLCSVGLIITPERKTFYGMVAATYITTDNLGALKEEGKGLIDYIFDRMESMDDE